jgi:hypothetical protein
MNLIGSIHKVDYEDLDEIAVFDLGLNAQQKSIIEKIEKVKLMEIEKIHPEMTRYFKTNADGREVRGWYTWKPVVFKQALEFYPYFLYLDAGSTVLKPPHDLFNHIQQNGIFLIHLSPIPIEDRMTRAVREKVMTKLLKHQADFILRPDTPMIDAGMQGISQKVFNSYVQPLYVLAHDVSLFEDDGSAKLGFGAGRHDQTLFSIYAHANNFKLNNQGWSQLQIDGKQVPFHMHHSRHEVNQLTSVYRSRADYQFEGDRLTFIHWKK